jgi:hypothetical protein
VFERSLQVQVLLPVRLVFARESEAKEGDLDGIALRGALPDARTGEPSLLSRHMHNG